MDLLNGCGEVGALISKYDWSSTSLGPIESWPPSLSNSVSLLLRSPVPIVMLWGEDGIMLYNDAYSVFAGGRHPGQLGCKVREGWPEVAEFNDNVMRVGLAGGTLIYKDQELTLYRNGQRAERLTMDLNYSPVLDESGTPAGVICVFADTTERVAADRRLTIERERQRLMLQKMPGFVALLSEPAHRFLYVNDAFVKLSGKRTFVGQTVRDVFPELAGQGFFERLDQVFSSGKSLTARALPIALRRLDGNRFIDFQFEPVRDDEGTVTGIFVGGYDVTDRVREERRREALLKLDDRLREIDDTHECAYVSAEILGDALAACRVGYGDIDTRAGTITVGRTWSLPGLTDVSGPHDFADYGTYVDELRSGRTVTVTDVEEDPRTKDRAAVFHALGIRAFLDAPVMEAGRAVVEVFVHSATRRIWTEEDVVLAHEFAERTRATIARKEAEQELRLLNETLERRVGERTAELMKAEESLRQSQKMEAVGQLTGGIAHDFNNLLVGITGSLELLQRRVAAGRSDGIERFASTAMNSAQRAAALTQRLLAFARRQPLDPKRVDANRLIASMEDLLRRSLGPGIALEMVSSGGLWLTQCDPNQLENAILNLAINSRDAMPDGGRLTVETANSHLDEAYVRSAGWDIKAGQYVCISATDTGTGMPADIIAKAFDPFFTTKPLGQGTGLGLSMLYGFVKQSGGHVKIYSEVGQGTTIKIYLPRFRDASDGSLSSTPAHADLGELNAEAGETVLVIDDEASVRMLVTETLEELGYAAMEAAEGRAALRILESDARIDLLVTDVGLPGLNGRQIADAARVFRPNLKVLFMTGYAHNAAIGNHALQPGMKIITKPFPLDELAKTIRDMIES